VLIDYQETIIESSNLDYLFQSPVKWWLTASQGEKIGGDVNVHGWF